MGVIKGFFQFLAILILYLIYIAGFSFIGLYLYPRYPIISILLLIIYVPSPLVVSNWRKIFKSNYAVKNFEYNQEPDLIEVEGQNGGKTDNPAVTPEQYKTKKIPPMIFIMGSVEFILCVVIFIAAFIFKLNIGYKGELFFILLLVAFSLYVVSAIEEKYKLRKESPVDEIYGYIVLDYLNHFILYLLGKLVLYVFCFVVTAVILTLIYISFPVISIPPTTIIIVLLIIIIFKLSDKE